MSKLSYLSTYSYNNMVSTIDYDKLIKLLAQYSNLEEDNIFNKTKNNNKKLIRKKQYGNKSILGN